MGISSAIDSTNCFFKTKHTAHTFIFQLPDCDADLVLQAVEAVQAGQVIIINNFGVAGPDKPCFIIWICTFWWVIPETTCFFKSHDWITCVSCTHSHTLTYSLTFYLFYPSLCRSIYLIVFCTSAFSCQIWAKYHHFIKRIISFTVLLTFRKTHPNGWRYNCMNWSQTS